MADIAPLIPGGEKLWGSNLSLWPARWASWDWSTIQKEIDLAVALGANCIRALGDVMYVINGTPSSATIKAQWTQLADYVTGLGYYLYPGGPASGWGPKPNPTDAQFETSVGDMIAALDGYSNIISYDLLNEVQAWNASPAVTAAAVFAYAKARTARPCTFDWIVSVLGDLPPPAYITDHADYLDFHTVVAGAATTAHASFPNKSIFISEISAAEILTDVQRAAVYATAMGNAAPSYVVGLGQWAIVDHPAITDTFGLVQSDLATVYPQVTQAWRQGQSAPLASRYRMRMVRGTNTVTWRVPPIANWTADRLYKDGVKVYEGALSRYVDGSGLSGIYEACAFDGTTEGPRVKMDARFDQAQLVVSSSGGGRGR